MEFNIYIILVNDVIPSFKFPDIFCGFTFFISFHVFNVFMDSVGLGLRLGHGQKTNDQRTSDNHEWVKWKRLHCHLPSFSCDVYVGICASGNS